MSNTSETDNEELSDYQELAIEGELPLKAVGIENLKEANPKHMPPHRYIHPWFARRPTPAARLAVLGSVMPSGTSPDEILSLMQIGPDGVESEISKYVEQKKITEGERDGTLGEWYGYPRPFTQTPTESETATLHEKLRETWDGELPTVLDATAGGGVIPFESIRYGLPTIANELNPVPSLMLKVMLEYAPEVGSLEDELYHWRDKVQKTAKKNIKEYYPTERDGREILASACTYTIECESCGGTVPTTPKWWVQKKSSSEGIAIQPEYTNGEVSYNCIELTDDSQNTDSFDPSEGNVSRGDVECPHCNIVMESDQIREKFKNNNFDYEIYGVKYDEPNGGSGYRAGTETDQKAIRKARNRIESDFDLMTFLATSIPSGQKTDEPKGYGINEWRDMFNPRQLISHYEYLQAYNKHIDEIREEYDQRTAEAILTLLALPASKMVDYNSRLSAWNIQRGYPNQIFKANNLSFVRMMVDNNLSATNMGYEAHSRKVIDCYEKLAEMVEINDAGTVHCNDAAELTGIMRDESIQAAVIDPPYYDSIMYAELSDVFYVMQKEYLGSVQPDLFEHKLTNKDDEAVANASKFDEISGNSSKKELAKQDYEKKMRDIFTELYDVLDSGGVLTIMFTHKKTDAWDTLATSLIEAGFTITSTHPITSEIPTRAGMQGSNSADSTILLTGRKPITEQKESQKTLWNDVKSQTQAAATKAANELHDSGLSLTKTDTIISTFGPTLQVYADNYPVVDKKGDTVPPRDALTEARNAAVEVLVERHLDTDEFDELDGLTKWVTLSWLVYEDDTFPYDEGRQLGLGVGIDVDTIKKDTKIWGKRTGDIQLKNQSSRVQDIVRLESGADVSSRKYPVNPTNQRFTYAIDAVHSAIHVYKKQGPKAAWEWLSERTMKTNSQFETTVTALLEVLPSNSGTSESLRALISGETGEYLEIDTDGIEFSFGNDDDNDQMGLEAF